MARVDHTVNHRHSGYGGPVSWICRTIWLALLVAVVCPASAAGQTYTVMPVSSASPADGATFASNHGRIPFEMVSPYTGVSLSVEVATQNIPGQDGTLAQDYQVDFFGVRESDAFPGTYRGQANYVPDGLWWSSTPGTYYWQAHGTCFDYTGARPHCAETVMHYMTPVYRIVIQAPSVTPPGSPPPSPPPGGGRRSRPNLSMSLGQARIYARRMIRTNSANPRRLGGTCRRGSYRSFRCSLRWRARRFAYSGRARFWHYASAGRVWWDFEFHGKRRRLDCQRRCVTRVTW